MNKPQIFEYIQQTYRDTVNPAFVVTFIKQPPAFKGFEIQNMNFNINFTTDFNSKLTSNKQPTAFKDHLYFVQ